MGRKTSIYASDALESVLEPRVSLARGISQTLTVIGIRYAEIVRRELAELELADDEWSAIYEALSGLAGLEQWSPAYLPAQISDAIGQNALDQKWRIDGARLMRRLGACSYAQLVAICDRAEVFWAAESAS